MGFLGPRNVLKEEGQYPESEAGTGGRGGGDLNQGTEGPQTSSEIRARFLRLGAARLGGLRPRNSGERHPRRGGAAPRWLWDPDECSPVKASWSALLNTLSLCSLTQPRVLRRLERKPTAAAISGSMSVLFPWLMSGG